MALKAILSKLDEVEEGQRGLYVARGDKFVLDVDAESAEEAFAAGLKRNRDEALADAKKAKKALAAYEGIDPEEHKRLKAAADKAEEEAARASGNWEAREKQLVAAHAKEREADATKIGKLTKVLEKRLVRDELRKAITEHKGLPDMQELLIEHGAKFVRVRELDDDFEAVVVDERGQPRVADGKGTPMNIGAFVEQDLMTRFPRGFEGTGSSGGGASKSSDRVAGSPKVIAAGDDKAFIQNLDGVAKGTVEVRE